MPKDVERRQQWTEKHRETWPLYLTGDHALRHTPPVITTPAYSVVHPEGVAWRSSPSYSDRLTTEHGPPCGSTQHGHLVHGDVEYLLVEGGDYQRRRYLPIRAPNGAELCARVPSELLTTEGGTAQWVTLTDQATGRDYYHNTATGATTWEQPLNTRNNESTGIYPTAVAGDPGLPFGWKRCATPDGREYFEDHNTQTTHWSLPGNSPQSHSNTSTSLRRQLSDHCVGSTTELQSMEGLLKLSQMLYECRHQGGFDVDTLILLLPQVFHESVSAELLRQCVEVLDQQLAKLHTADRSAKQAGLVDSCTTLVSMCCIAMCGSVHAELNSDNKPTIRNLAIETLQGIILNLCGPDAISNATILDVFVDHALISVESNGIPASLMSPSARQIAALGDSAHRSMEAVLQGVRRCPDRFIVNYYIHASYLWHNSIAIIYKCA